MPTLTLTPTKHAQLQGNDPDINLGGVASDVLAIQNQATVILRHVLTFDLSTLPAGATIASAVIRLYYFVRSGAPPYAQLTFRVHRLTQAWVESQVTWNSYSTGNLWATAGGDFAAAGVDGTTPADEVLTGVANELDVENLFDWGNLAIADCLFKYAVETAVSPNHVEAHWDTRLFFNNRPPELVIVYAVKGHLWVEGLNLHYTDQTSDTERIAKYETEAKTF